jgi:hypothetical protein
MNLKPNCFEKTKEAWGIFSFFSSTNVETKNVCPIAANGPRLCEEADFGAQNCQHTTKADAWQNVQLTTEPAFLQNRCYLLAFCSPCRCMPCQY